MFGCTVDDCSYVVCLHSEEESGKEQLAEEAKAGIKELMTAASVSHAMVAIQTVLL